MENSPNSSATPQRSIIWKAASPKSFSSRLLPGKRQPTRNGQIAFSRRRLRLPAIRADILNHQKVEAKVLVAASYQHRVDTSFPGWAPTDPTSGQAPPNWKVTMLVLLGLYPIVCLEILFLMKRLAQLGLKSALASFVGNAISVALVAYVTMPYLVRWLNWWLLPKPGAPKSVHWKGTLVVFALYALSVAIFWKFM